MVFEDLDRDGYVDMTSMCDVWMGDGSHGA